MKDALAVFPSGEYEAAIIKWIQWGNALLLFTEALLTLVHTTLIKYEDRHYTLHNG